MIYYRVSTKSAENKELNIPESSHYFYTGDTYKTEAEAIKAALLFLSCGRFTSARVIKFETEVVQTYNKEEVSA